MNLIFDACTVLNLLQVDLIGNSDDGYTLDNDYIKRVKKMDNFQVQITEKVLEEIKKNYHKNSLIQQKNSFLKSYIERDLHNLVDYTLNSDDFKSALEFTKKVTTYNKDNGELHSTAYALYLNRYLDNTTFNSYFITDDDGAINDFENFFRINLLGPILTTIDLLLILERYNIITLSEIFRFSSNLKRHYIHELDELADRIIKLQKKITVKESALLTQLLQYLVELDFEKVSNKIVLHPLYSSIKSSDKNIDSLLQKILSSDFKKVKILDNRIKEIRNQYWTTDKI